MQGARSEPCRCPHPAASVRPVAFKPKGQQGGGRASCNPDILQSRALAPPHPPPRAVPGRVRLRRLSPSAPQLRRAPCRCLENEESSKCPYAAQPCYVFWLGRKLRACGGDIPIKPPRRLPPARQARQALARLGRCDLQGLEVRAADSACRHGRVHSPQARKGRSAVCPQGRAAPPKLLPVCRCVGRQRGRHPAASGHGQYAALQNLQAGWIMPRYIGAIGGDGVAVSFASRAGGQLREVAEHCPP